MIIPFPTQNEHLTLVMTVEHDASGWYVLSRRGMSRHILRAVSDVDAWDTLAKSAAFFGIDLPDWAQSRAQEGE